MKLLLLILLFPLFAAAQMGGGIAQYTAQCHIKYGVLVNSATMSNTDKANQTKDSLGAIYARGAFVIQGYPGAGTGGTKYEVFAAKGITQLSVINYRAGTGTPQPFPTSGQLAGYADTLDMILDSYQPEVVVIENEELNTNFNSGPIANYQAEVIAASAVVHAHGLKLSDGGTYGVALEMKTYRYLAGVYPTQHYADTFAKYSTMSALAIANAKVPNTTPALEQTITNLDSILVLAPYLDFFNIHPYEPYYYPGIVPDSAKVAAPYVYRFFKEAIEGLTGRPIMTNETGQRTNEQPDLVTSLLTQYYNNGYRYAQWFDGVGDADARPLNDMTTGFVYPNGHAFYNYITTHQTPEQLPH